MTIDNLIFYQIYPKSFYDTDNDGLGDLEGVRQKIGYLKELGINAVWITPCYESPQKDNGYDISDYRKIASDMGGMSAFKRLVEDLHKHGIKVVMDLVANHTSTQHVWFQESRKSKDNPYREYYIWRATPPNNWQSTFGGDAWEYDEKTGEYYLHSFAIEQADLNWENPKVREEIKAVVDFWIEQGVDGFRCDVLDMISKTLEDENGNGGGPRLHEFIRELFGRETATDIFTVGECWSSDKENVTLFCAPERKELTTVFAFGHLCWAGTRFTTDKPRMQELCARMAEWQTLTQEAGVYNTSFLENHDQPRCVSRFGDDKKYRYESATLLGGLTLLQRGIPFLFQGQEIGVTNSCFSDMRNFDDVEEWNYYQEAKDKLPLEEILARINAGGRDNARRPFPWNGEDKKSWIADYTRKDEVNLERDLRSEKSVFRFFQKLIALRKEQKAISQGTFELLHLSETHSVFKREYGGKIIVVLCAFEQGASLQEYYGGETLINNYPEFSGDKLSPWQLVAIKK